MISDKLDIRQKQFIVEPLRGKDAMKILNLGTAALKAVGIEYKVGGGTLLGLVRDKDFIPHDTDLDVDVCVKGSVNKEIGDLVNLMTFKGFDVIRQQTYEDKFMQLAFIHTGTHIIFDIYFYYEKLLKGHDFINVNEHGILMYPATYWFNIMPVEEYLSLRYGDNWRTPQGSKSDWELDAERLMINL